ncbi:MAG: T9SS type A sorting domain-containing protein [Bacteroidota bacterium]
MKRTLPFLFLFCFSFCLSAQHTPHITEPVMEPQLPSPSPSGTYNEVGVPPADSPVEFRDEEVRIGITRYETQAVASLGRRVTVLPDGRVSAAWLHGLDENAGWPDRGTAYNQFDGTEWADEPDVSIEQIRSGFPNFTSTPNGLEVVLSHKNTSAVDWRLQVLTKMPDETTWTETEIPTNTPNGLVWSKLAVGGTDGKTIHGVAQTLATGFDGAIYEGIDGHPLYYRSTDNGLTWDMFDVIIPGLDSNFYNQLGGETYNIAARGETVVIGVFEAWGDVAIFKSTDNGMNWEKTIILDHPLDKYDDSGYGPGDVPFDPAVPDSTSILSTDNSGSLIIDDNGNVHVFFGLMYINGSAGARNLIVQNTDGTVVFDGIAYWTEGYSTGQFDVIANSQDIDGDGVVSVSLYADIRYVNANFTSRPTPALDDDGNIYVVYTSMREDLLSFEQTTYRHVFIVKSEDGGATWSQPFDLINPDVSEFYDFIEASYPSIPERIGDKIDLIYVQDFEPGLTPMGIMVAEHSIMHVTYDKNTFDPSFTTTIPQLSGEVILSPNPAIEAVTMQFELNEPSDALYRIFDSLGKQVFLSKRENLLTGLHRETFDVSSLAGGMYFVQIEINGASISNKLVVDKK